MSDEIKQIAFTIKRSRYKETSVALEESQIMAKCHKCGESKKADSIVDIKRWANGHAKGRCPCDPVTDITIMKKWFFVEVEPVGK
jgi:hypothetical protein